MYFCFIVGFEILGFLNRHSTVICMLWSVLLNPGCVYVVEIESLCLKILAFLCGQYAFTKHTLISSSLKNWFLCLPRAGWVQHITFYRDAMSARATLVRDFKTHDLPWCSSKESWNLPFAETSFAKTNFSYVKGISLQLFCIKFFIPLYFYFTIYL